MTVTTFQRLRGDEPGPRPDGLPPEGSAIRAAGTDARPSRLRRLVQGPADAPVWARPALLLLLAATALLYLWDLSASGNGNSYYAAAVEAGTKSWKALFFGSLDSSNFITVDKPPAALWVMGLSGRLFGFSSWSMLAPQALMGVASVGLLAAGVRRIAGDAAGLLAGAALALTPAAVLMFRFNNPDALLVLLMVVAGYCVTRALETARTGWLVAAGAAIGFAFLTKMMQAFLPVPGLAFAYLLAAPTGLGRRLLQLLAAGVAVLVSAGWWVAAVSLWPASSRPYIGGSTNNSVMDLVLGYNGLGRLLGNSGGNGGGGAGGGGGPGGGTGTGTSFGGATGVARLFSNEFGNEISWLLPAALLALVAGLWATRRLPRTDPARASLVLWGGWLLVTGVVFAYMRGTVHPYYTVALAPAIAATLAVGLRVLWVTRGRESSRVGLAVVLAAAGCWSAVLLGRSSWHPGLRYVVLAATLGLAVAVALPARWRQRTVMGLVSAAMVVGLLGSSAYAVTTAATPHTGSIPTVGPASAGGGGMGGPGGSAGSGQPGSGQAGAGQAGAGQTGAGSSVSALLARTTSTWAAATVGDQSAAELALSSGKAVMAIGGWSGSDPTPTLAQFQQYVAEGKVSYFVSGGGMGGGMGGGQGGPGGSSGTASAITAWVTAHYTATTVGNTTVYDLTSAS